MCLFPGAKSARPGRTESPSFASRTSISQSSFNLFANEAVNPSGMCWVMMIPGTCLGRAVSTFLSASVPPVELPIAMILCVVSIEASDGDAILVGTVVSRSAFATIGSFAMSRISRPSSLAMSPTVYDSAGFPTTPNAPALRHSKAVSHPFCVSELTMIVRTGWNFMSLRRNVSPSIRGISISSVITSGSSAMILSRAMYGSGATPTTSMPGWALRPRLSACRTIDESSTISTRTSAMRTFLVRLVTFRGD